MDRAYSREEKVAAVLESQQVASKKDAVVDSLAKDLSTSVTITTNSKRASAAGAVLAHIISQFPSDLIFAQDDEKQSVWLRLLPDELLVSILRRLDVTSIERFALVCRKARMLSLDATLWRWPHFPLLLVPVSNIASQRACHDYIQVSANIANRYSYEYHGTLWIQLQADVH